MKDQDSTPAIPRRNQRDRQHIIEQRIQDLIWVVERLGAAEELTNCIIKLNEAKDHFSNHVDYYQESNWDTNGPSACPQ